MYAVKDCLSGYTNWVSRVKKLLDDYGFSEVFLNVSTCNSFVKFFPSIFKSRIIDCFRQEWFGSIDRNRVLDEYNMFKVNFIYEEYLDSVPHNLRCFITRLRISAHSLRIHTGRFGVNRLPKHERLFLNYNLQDVEDVYHFVFICPKYRTIRLKYINRYYYVRPSVYKFYDLLSRNDKKRSV